MRLLIAALIASLALNAYLVFGRSSGGNDVEPGEAPPIKSSASATKIAFAPSPSNPASYGTLERKVLERRVLAAEAQVEEYLPPNEKFAKLTRSMETETRIAPYLERVFKGLPGPDPKYAVECRGRICRLDPKVTGDANAWMRPLQSSYPDRASLFRGMMFTFGHAFLEVRTVGEELAGKIHYDAERYVHACLHANPEPGELTYQLVMDRGYVSLRSSGTLRDHPVGKCIAEALRQSIAKFPAPPGVAVEDVEHTVTLPLEDGH
jgi:hypothetical protein